MNLYNLHTNGSELDGYEHYDTLKNTVTKTVYDIETVYKNVLGETHRDEEDGAAVFFENGTQYWYKYGLRHRIGGPAVTFENGRTEYWIDGKQIHNTGFKK